MADAKRKRAQDNDEAWYVFLMDRGLKKVVATAVHWKRGPAIAAVMQAIGHAEGAPAITKTQDNMLTSTNQQRKTLADQVPTDWGGPEPMPDPDGCALVNDPRKPAGSPHLFVVAYHLTADAARITVGIGVSSSGVMERRAEALVEVLCDGVPAFAWYANRLLFRKMGKESGDGRRLMTMGSVAFVSKWLKQMDDTLAATSPVARRSGTARTRSAGGLDGAARSSGAPSEEDRLSAGATSEAVKLAIDRTAAQALLTYVERIKKAVGDVGKAIGGGNVGLLISVEGYGGQKYHTDFPAERFKSEGKSDFTVNAVVSARGRIETALGPVAHQLPHSLQCPTGVVIQVGSCTIHRGAILPKSERTTLLPWDAGNERKCCNLRMHSYHGAMYRDTTIDSIFIVEQGVKQTFHKKTPLEVRIPRQARN